MNSKQSFRFEIPYSIKLLQVISKGNNKKEKIANVTGAGEPKIMIFLEWLQFINSIKIEKGEIYLTKLGKIYLQIHESDNLLEPLMLYHLLRDPKLEKNGGQFYFSEIVNILSDQIIFGHSNIIKKKQIEKEISNLGIKEKYFKFITSAINTLQDSDAGFGKMEILKEIPDQKESFKVRSSYSYWLEPLIAAYIIYDMCEEGQTTISIDKITTDKYNLGRMFLLNKDIILELLEDIQHRKLITIEGEGELQRIRINPNVNKNYILNMILLKDVYQSSEDETIREKINLMANNNYLNMITSEIKYELFSNDNEINVNKLIAENKKKIVPYEIFLEILKKFSNSVLIKNNYEFKYNTGLYPFERKMTGKTVTLSQLEIEDFSKLTEVIHDASIIFLVPEFNKQYDKENIIKKYKELIKDLPNNICLAVPNNFIFDLEELKEYGALQLIEKEYQAIIKNDELVNVKINSKILSELIPKF